VWGYKYKNIVVVNRMSNTVYLHESFAIDGKAEANNLSHKNHSAISNYLNAD